MTTYLPDPTGPWQDRAQCRDVDPDTMQPEEATPEQLTEALSTCLGCPVRSECLTSALEQQADESSEAYGIWAGKWWGVLPRVPGSRACGWCGSQMNPMRSTATYCGGGCRSKAHHARRAISA